MAGFQQLYASDTLGVKGIAKIRGNFDGPFIPKLKIFDSGFTADASESDWVSTTGSNGLTLSHSATDGGEQLMTLGSTEDDCGEFYHTAQWSAASEVGALFKLKISRITTICVCAGLVDAYTNTNDKVAMQMNGTAMVDMTNTADAVGMVFDTDATTDVWYCQYAENGTEGTPFQAKEGGSTLTPTAATYFYVALQSNTDGDVDFYYGTAIDTLSFVGHKADAVAATSTDLWTPYVGLISRTTSAATCYISRIVVWQNN